VLPRIVGKFGNREESTPSSSLTSSPGVKILLNSSVHMLYLSISTGVESSREILLDLQGFCHFFCEHREVKQKSQLEIIHLGSPNQGTK